MEYYYTDYKDEEIGDLVMLERLPQGAGKHSKWKALCKRCNKECEISTNVLPKLKNKCCQKCSRLSTRKDKYISGHMFQQMMAAAKIRNIEFNISIKYISELFDTQNQKCGLTGMQLIFAENAKKHQKGGTTASLDRKDNTKGYIEGNVWWVHKRINIMKRTDSVKEFVDWCKKVASYSESLDNDLKVCYTTTVTCEPNGG